MTQGNELNIKVIDFILISTFHDFAEISSKVFDLKNQQNFTFIKDETEDEIIQRGLIERVFGGVGPQTELPTTP